MSQTSRLFRVFGLASLAWFSIARHANAEEALQARVYGFLNAQVERVWATGGATPYAGRFRVSDGGSRLGFMGRYSLGFKTYALWQIEGALQGFDQGGYNDKGSPIIIASRNTYVGMENDYAGKLMVGHYDSAYRSLVGTGGAMGGNLGLSVLGLDLWNNTDAQLSGNVKNIFSRGESRYPNSLHYFTPAWSIPLPVASSLQLAGSYSLDEAQSPAGSRARYSVAGLVRVGAFALGAAYDYQANTGIDGQALEQGFGVGTQGESGASTYFYKVVASFQPHTGSYVGFGFERCSYGFVQFIPPSYSDYHAHLINGHLKQDGVMLSLAQAIGPVTLMASAGAMLNPNQSLYGENSDYRARQFSLGTKVNFSDNFGGYVFYTVIRNGPRQDVNLGTPIYSNNVGTAQAYLAPGNSPQVIGTGLIARF
jgi:predicted porin